MYTFSRKMIIKTTLLSLFILIFVLSANTNADNDLSRTETVLSPDGNIKINFILDNGVPTYEVYRGKKAIIKTSKLGFELKDTTPLDQNFAFTGAEFESIDYTWTQPWGEVKDIRDNYNLMTIDLKNKDGWFLTISFRAYNDGIAFRYKINNSQNVLNAVIMDEVTEFHLAGDYSAWWIPAYAWNRYEYLYKNNRVSELDTVHTPLTMEAGKKLFLSIHEAALTNYSSMTLANNGNNVLECDLVPWSDGVKVRAELPIKTPWRTIQIAESAGDLITSYLILNCNEASKIEDTSWIKPAKYIGIWWDMHIGTRTWESGAKHGATTDYTKLYIDFAAKNGIGGVLVEGWNYGWDGDWIANSDSFRFCEPYEDYNLAYLAAYAKRNKVGLIAHNETSAGILNYETQMEDAYKLYNALGIHMIKSGYVRHSRDVKRKDPATGEIIGLEWHHGQYMVNHYRKVVELAAKYQIMLDVHEPIKPTGIRRTWPNMMTREGARGQEFNAWGPEGGNPPEHQTILPFTRLLAGPFDFTPGVFDIFLKSGDRPNNRINTTLAKQLALYVTIYSPLHMAADLPQNYEARPDEFQFIKDVPTDWSETVVLNGDIGDYVTIARKDRSSEDWYLGSVTDENKRTLKVKLDFLDEGREYTAQIYADGKDAIENDNPLSTELSEIKVTSKTKLNIILAPSGGQAIRFIPVD